MTGLAAIIDEAARRTLDLVASVVGLVALGPLLVALGVAVKATSPGPALFRHCRVGRRCATFDVLKFRTMYEGAGGSELTVGGDLRVTPLGRFLRLWKLDELPQLYNVLRGDMSFVGPRPEAPCFVESYTALERRLLDFRPGITGAAQLAYMDEEMVLVGCADAGDYYRRNILAAKAKLDLEYLETRSVPKDFVLVCRTVVRLLSRRRSRPPLPLRGRTAT